MFSAHDFVVSTRRLAGVLVSSVNSVPHLASLRGDLPHVTHWKNLALSQPARLRSGGLQPCRASVCHEANMTIL
jgi:hypothetical protein